MQILEKEQVTKAFSAPIFSRAFYNISIIFDQNYFETGLAHLY